MSNKHFMVEFGTMPWQDANSDFALMQFADSMARELILDVESVIGDSSYNDFIGAIGGAIKNAVTKAGGAAAKKAPTNAGDAIKNAAGTIKNKATEFGHSVRTGFNGGFNNMTRTARAGTAIGKAGKKVVNAGKAVGTAAKNNPIKATAIGAGTAGLAAGSARSGKN